MELLLRDPQMSGGRALSRVLRLPRLHARTPGPRRTCATHCRVGIIEPGQGHSPDPALVGQAPDAESSEEADFSAKDAPENILELAAACDRFVQSKYGVPLDFTGDTLSLVDQYVREVRESVKKDAAAFDLVAFAVGGYLGETMRRTFGGEWFVEGEPRQYRLYFTRVKLSTNPMGLAREALLAAEDEDFPSSFVVDPLYRAFVEERLKDVQPVSEDEYFLPSTRFDTAAFIVELLHAKMALEGQTRQRFSRVDY